MALEEVPFSELLSVVIDNRGKTCPTADSGIPLIATNCVRNDLLYPVYEKVRFVSQETYESWFRGHPEPGDILFVNKATPGRVCLVPDPIDFCIAQDMVAVRANPDVIYPRYLFAALRSPLVQDRISQMHVGSLIPHFKKGDFDKLRLPIPTKAEQRFIGDCYFNLSAKIELNRRRNQTLEAMARALFKDWFVDFGPVRAKMEGREPYLPADLWQLFPDRLDDEGKPDGWRSSTIGSEVIVCGGSTPSTKEPAFWEGGEHHWATPKDLSVLAFPVLLDTDRKVTDAGITKISSGLLPAGTVLLSSRAPIGYLAVAEVPTAINQGFIAMKCEGSLPNVFVLFWCRENMDLILGNANGSTFQEISKSNFRPIPLVVPSMPILKVFQDRTNPLYRRLVENERESRTLAQLRDTLLPKLISGEVRANPLSGRPSEG